MKSLSFKLFFFIYFGLLFLEKGPLEEMGHYSLASRAYLFKCIISLKTVIKLIMIPQRLRNILSVEVVKLNRKFHFCFF